MNDYEFFENDDIAPTTLMYFEKEISKRKAIIPLSSIEVNDDDEEITFKDYMEEEKNYEV